MRHGKKIAKLGRTAPHRKAMLSNMMTSLFINERVTTTQTRAKELKRTAERVLTCAKKGDLHSRRQVLRVIADKQVVAKLFDELGPRYKSRNGGYTRLIKLGPRRGDAAFMSIVELVDRPGVTAEETQEAPAAKEVQQAEE